MHAWNYGRRIAGAGYGPPMHGFGPLGPPERQFTDLEYHAQERLGYDSFLAWALRGWWAAHTERSSA